MRCDLHVHTVHSGLCTVPVLSRICLESYNQPGAIYERAKARGMDLVTVTDHDSIDASEELRRYPDFFLSEEVSCQLPSGTKMHAGVYGINERDHIQLQRRKNDIESLLAYARENRLFLAANHLYSSLTGPRTEEDFILFAREFEAIETRNGQMLKVSNDLAREFAAQFGKTGVAGSDSHSMHGIGKTWTNVPHSKSVDEYLSGLRNNTVVIGGEHGSWWKLTCAVNEIGLSLMRSQRWTSAFFGLLAVAPAVTLGNYVREIAFARHWRQRVHPDVNPALPTPCLGQKAA